MSIYNILVLITKILHTNMSTSAFSNDSKGQISNYPKISLSLFRAILDNDYVECLFQKVLKFRKKEIENVTQFYEVWILIRKAENLRTSKKWGNYLEIILPWYLVDTNNNFEFQAKSITLYIVCLCVENITMSLESFMC